MGQMAIRTKGARQSRGNVGIGTTSPNYKLDVKGDINATSYRSNGTDYAENFEKLHADESIEAGDVVAVVSEKITKAGNPGTGTPALYMVVTDSAGVIGGGGGANTGGAGFADGARGNYGGGGGSASANGSNSGAGGNGAAGIVVVVTYF